MVISYTPLYSAAQYPRQSYLW